MTENQISDFTEEHFFGTSWKVKRNSENELQAAYCSNSMYPGKEIPTSGRPYIGFYKLANMWHGTAFKNEDDFNAYLVTASWYTRYREPDPQTTPYKIVLAVADMLERGFILDKTNVLVEPYPSHARVLFQAPIITKDGKADEELYGANWPMPDFSLLDLFSATPDENGYSLIKAENQEYLIPNTDLDEIHSYAINNDEVKPKTSLESWLSKASKFKQASPEASSSIQANVKGLRLYVANGASLAKGEVKGGFINIPTTDQAILEFLRNKVGIDNPEAASFNQATLTQKGAITNAGAAHIKETARILNIQGNLLNHVGFKPSKNENLRDLNALASQISLSFQKQNYHNLEAAQKLINASNANALKAANIVNQRDKIRIHMLDPNQLGLDPSTSQNKTLGISLAIHRGFIKALSANQALNDFNFESWTASQINNSVFISETKDVNKYEKGYIDITECDIDFTAKTASELAVPLEPPSTPPRIKPAPTTRQTRAVGKDVPIPAHHQPPTTTETPEKPQEPANPPITQKQKSSSAPATAAQEKVITRAIGKDPSLKDSSEYRAYLRNPTVATARAFLNAHPKIAGELPAINAHRQIPKAKTDNQEPTVDSETERTNAKARRLQQSSRNQKLSPPKH